MMQVKESVGTVNHPPPGSWLAVSDLDYALKKEF